MLLHASPSRSPDGGRLRWTVAVAILVLTSAAVASVVGGHLGDQARGPHVADEADRLVIEGPSSETAHYEFTVNGTLEPADVPDAAIEDADELNATRAAGTVNGSDVDAYRLSGDVTSLTLAGNATLFLNGREITPANLTDGWAVTFVDCSTVEITGEFTQGYAFSTVVFPVWGPDGDLMGFEENPVNEPFAVTDRSGSLRAGATLPENVSEFAVLRSVFLYEEPVDAEVDPLLVESEVAAELGEPSVQVQNPAHEACRTDLEDRLANRTSTENGTATSGT